MIYTWYISLYSLRIEHQFHEFLLGILCKLTFLSFPHFFFPGITLKTVVMLKFQGDYFQFKSITSKTF